MVVSYSSLNSKLFKILSWLSSNRFLLKSHLKVIHNPLLAAIPTAGADQGRDVQTAQAQDSISVTLRGRDLHAELLPTHQHHNTVLEQQGHRNSPWDKHVPAVQQECQTGILFQVIQHCHPDKSTSPTKEETSQQIQQHKNKALHREGKNSMK